MWRGPARAVRGAGHNGTADLATLDTHGSHYRWRVSRDGLGDWVTLMPPTLAPPAAIGAFSPDDPRASLLVWSAKTLWRVNLAEAPARHARQDMR